MRTELESHDVESIAQKVAEIIKPMLGKTAKAGIDDTIFDVKNIASYLAVTTKWIYERTHLKEIPYFKVGGQLRFRKRDIDKWIEANAVPVSGNPPRLDKK